VGEVPVMDSTAVVIGILLLIIGGAFFYIAVTA
jgi:hypothetical protein